MDNDINFGHNRGDTGDTHVPCDDNRASDQSQHVDPGSGYRLENRFDRLKKFLIPSAFAFGVGLAYGHFHRTERTELEQFEDVREDIVEQCLRVLSHPERGTYVYNPDNYSLSPVSQDKWIEKTTDWDGSVETEYVDENGDSEVCHCKVQDDVAVTSTSGGKFCLAGRGDLEELTIAVGFQTNGAEMQTLFEKVSIERKTDKKSCVLKNSSRFTVRDTVETVLDKPTCDRVLAQTHAELFELTEKLGLKPDPTSFSSPAHPHSRTPEASDYWVYAGDDE